MGIPKEKKNGETPIFYKSIFGAQLWYIPSVEGLLLGEFSEVKLDKRS